MTYTKEEFLLLYEQWKTLKNKIIEALRSNVSVEAINKENVAKDDLYSKLIQYAKHLVEQNPDDKSIVCTVYGTFELKAPRIYEILSDRLKNDKLVTMLAIKKFDESAYGRLGNDLRSDPEVMYLLIKHTIGVSGISQCSPELLNNPLFWQEIFASRDTCLASEIGDNFVTVLNGIKQLNIDNGLNIDMELVKNQFDLAMKQKSRYSTLNIMGLYNSSWTYNPEIIQKVIDGDIETINKYLPNSKLKEELLSEEHNMEQSEALKI